MNVNQSLLVFAQNKNINDKNNDLANAQEYLISIDFPVLIYYTEISYKSFFSSLLYNNKISEESICFKDDKILISKKALSKAIESDYNIEFEETERPYLNIIDNTNDIDYYLNQEYQSPIEFIQNKIKQSKMIKKSI